MHTGPLALRFSTDAALQRSALHSTVRGRLRVLITIVVWMCSCTTLAWLPYHPLHPVVAAAVAQDAAPSEVAAVHFLSIAEAIRAHPQLRAHPALLGVDVADGADGCEVRPSASPSRLLPPPSSTRPRARLCVFPPSPFRLLPSTSPPSPSHPPLSVLNAQAEIKHTPAADDAEFTHTNRCGRHGGRAPRLGADDAVHDPRAARPPARHPARRRVCAVGVDAASVEKQSSEGTNGAGDAEEEVSCTQDLTFLRPEGARDFYAGVLEGLRSGGEVYDTGAHTFGGASKYPPTRVLRVRVRVFGDGVRLMRRQLAADCAAFGAALGHHALPRVCALAAQRALEGFAAVRREYIARDVRFAPDLLVRGACGVSAAFAFACAGAGGECRPRFVDYGNGEGSALEDEEAPGGSRGGGYGWGGCGCGDMGRAGGGKGNGSGNGTGRRSRV
ncbi:hypothetical protein B0H10DRAFT_2183276 [Mycena sp. CBHHK59/15]|nr:hypothetical protein B0H10DRAFT_2183276 [Mycena sp. CBHHK59/15]